MKIFRIFLALMLASFVVFLTGCSGSSSEIDQLIDQAKKEAMKPVPSVSFEVPVVQESPRDALVETKLMEIQEAKLRLKKVPVPGEGAAKTDVSGTSNETTKVTESPKADITAETSSSLTGASASTLTPANPLPAGQNSFDDTGQTTQPISDKPNPPKPAVSAFRSYFWGQSSSNNVVALRALTPDSGIWRDGKSHLSGFFVKISVKNIRVNPVNVRVSSFKLFTNSGRCYTATMANSYDDGHYPLFTNKLLLPNEVFTGYLHFVFMRSTQSGGVWAPDTSTVSEVRYNFGKPKIRYTY